MTALDTLQRLVDFQAETRSESPAFVSPDAATVTFGELRRQVGAIRTQLQSYGARRQSRIALLTPFGQQTPISILGVACHSVCCVITHDAPVEAYVESLKDLRADFVASIGESPVAVQKAADKQGIPIIQLTSDNMGTSVSEPLDQPSADDVAIIVRTSGSSGKAKVVPVTHSQLAARGDKSSRMLQLGPEDRCLNLMPFRYMHAIISGLMASLFSGSSLVCPGLIDKDVFFSCLENQLPTWYTAGASHHLNILNWLKRRRARHVLRFARSGSSSLPHDAREELERQLNIPFVESYSSTETGTMTTNPPNWERRPGSVGITPDDDVRIVDEQGHPVATGEVGEIVARGPSVVCGYDSDPGRTAESFYDGWYHTGDLGCMGADGFLQLKGRIGDVINRGGEKISPMEVELALLKHKSVSVAMAFAIPHKTLQSDVAAAVILRGGHQATAETLRKHLADFLPSARIPATIVFTAQLPLTDSGKPARSEGAKFFGLNQKRITQSASPVRFLKHLKTMARDYLGYQSPMERSLLAIFRGTLNDRKIGVDDDFFLSGGDSLAAMSVIADVRRELDLEITLQYFLERPTVRELARSLMWSPPSASDMIALHKSGTRRPVFAVAGRYGYAIRLGLVGRALDPQQPFYALQPPNMDWESVNCDSVEEFAAHYVRQMRAIQPDGPYRLLGASFGGIVVYEMALQLEAVGEQVELLALLDTYPTSCIVDGTLEPVESRYQTEGRGFKYDYSDTERKLADAHFHARGRYVMKEKFSGRIDFFICDSKGNQIADRRQLWVNFGEEVQYLPMPGSHGSYHAEPQFSFVRNQLTNMLNEIDTAQMVH